MAKEYTEKQWQAIEQRVAKLTEQKKAIQKELNFLKAKLAGREYRVNNYTPTDNTKRERGFAMKIFGKRRKDLTPEELREYNKLLNRKSRATRKIKEETK